MKLHIPEATPHRAKNRTIRAALLISAALITLLFVCGCSIRRISDQNDSETRSRSGVAAPTAEAEHTSGSSSPESEINEDTIPEVSTESESDSGEMTDVEADSSDEHGMEAPCGEYAPLVFMYHLILDEPYSPYEGLFVRPSEFSAHLEALNELGYRYEFAENYSESFEYPTAIITFDDGYEDNYTEMFPILRQLGGKATVFLATSLVGTPGYLTEEQIKEMSDSGLVSFQSHTVAHVDLSYQSADFIERDTKDAISYIEGLTGRAVHSMAYPAGSFNETVMDAVGKYVDLAYTTEAPSARSVNSPLAIPRIRINRGVSKEAFLVIIGY